MTKKTLVLLAEGFEEIEAVVSIDILRRAGVDVTVACIGSSEIVRGSRNIEIKSDMKVEEFNGLPDAIVLPGGMGGAENLANSEHVVDLIKKCFIQGKIVAAICAAPAVVLASTVILDNRKATCYPSMEERFSNNTRYVNEDVVVDGNIITSRGVGTALYFALEIVRQLLGKDAADEVKEKTLVK